MADFRGGDQGAKEIENTYLSKDSSVLKTDQANDRCIEIRKFETWQKCSALAILQRHLFITK